MTNKQEIQIQLNRLEKFNDPVMIMVIFLALPAVILATIFSNFGDGTLVKMAIAVCFLFFTGLSFKVSSIIKKRVETLKALLEEQAVESDEMKNKS